MPHGIAACAAGDIDEADLIRFDYSGATFAIYHSPDGNFHATAGKCTHDALDARSYSCARKTCAGRSDSGRNAKINPASSVATTPPVTMEIAETGSK